MPKTAMPKTFKKDTPPLNAQLDDATLTCPDLPPVADGLAEELVVTVVFHPDTRFIGARARVPARLPPDGWILGRNTPHFHREGESEQPLGDAHISRSAVRFARHRGQLLLERCPRSSRCNVSGEELSGTRAVTLSELRDGVSLQLAHCVVLCLKLGISVESSQQAGADLLRGSSPLMRQLREQLARAAASDLDVLLLGESGTGKEVAARVLHRASARYGGPLVPVNMAAVSADLAPAALFGATRGAFTGAERDQRGHFQRAEGGTLFLDEIGDTCSAVQPQLLRALQEREVQPLGGLMHTVNLRVVSATDARIDEEASGFRSALRHRLGAIEIRLPPLRERPEDVGELLLHFLRESAETEACAALLPAHMDNPLHIAAWARIFQSCLHSQWPGNVRQLANTARQIMLASGHDPVLPEALARMLSPRPVDHKVAEQNPGAGNSMSSVSDARFERAMRESGFEPQAVARVLGVSRSSVYRRIERSHYRLAPQIPEVELQEALLKNAGDIVAAARHLQVSASGLRARLRREFATDANHAG
ncbi:MAG: sigma-54-dependent transcriptional regulator [Halioglobus sp.]